MGQHVYVGIIMMSEIYKQIQSMVGAPVTCMWRFKMYKDSLVCIKKSLTLLMCHQQFTQTEGCNHNIVGLVFLRRLLTDIYNFQRAYLKQDSKVVKSLFFLIYNQDVIIVIMKDNRFSNGCLLYLYIRKMKIIYFYCWIQECDFLITYCSEYFYIQGPYSEGVCFINGNPLHITKVVFNFVHYITI